MKSICNLYISPENCFYEVDHCQHPLNELIPVVMLKDVMDYIASEKKNAQALAQANYDNQLELQEQIIELTTWINKQKEDFNNDKQIIEYWCKAFVIEHGLGVEKDRKIAKLEAALSSGDKFYVFHKVRQNEWVDLGMFKVSSIKKIKDYHQISFIK